jgi:hypothetical protein
LRRIRETRSEEEAGLFLAPSVGKGYGARLDRNTLEYLREERRPQVAQTRFLRRDIRLLIEGERVG